jgi:hypothetical protein
MRTRKTSGKPRLIPQLNAALNGSSIEAKSSISRSALRKIQDKARLLQVLSNRLESLPKVDREMPCVQDILMEIVKHAHELTMMASLSTALHASLVLDPSSKSSLPQAFGKLGRYYTAASELVCAARDRRCRIFLSVRIEECQIQVPRQDLALQMPVSVQDVVDLCWADSGLAIQKPKSFTFIGQIFLQ